MKKLILLLISLLLTGCMRYVELSNLEVVEHLKIDYQEEKFIIQATTTHKDDEEKSQKVITANGKTIDEAIKNIKIQQNKKFYIAHLNLLILTEDAINKKLQEIITYFINNTESRNDFSLALTKTLDLSKTETGNLKERIKIIEEDTGLSKSIEFEEFLKNLLENNKTIIPIIEIKEKMKISTIALIVDNKINTYLNEEETLLYNLLHNYISQSQIFENNILSSQTFFNFKNKNLNITIECTLANKEDTFSNNLEKSINEMYKKYKAHNIDIFDFTNYIKKSDPALYKKYKDNLIDNINIKINIKIKTSNKENKEDILS